VLGCQVLTIVLQECSAPVTVVQTVEVVGGVTAYIT
jgi:hypothetical protein